MAARTNAPASAVKKLISSPKANQPTTNIVGSSMLPAIAARADPITGAATEKRMLGISPASREIPRTWGQFEIRTGPINPASKVTNIGKSPNDAPSRIPAERSKGLRSVNLLAIMHMAQAKETGAVNAMSKEYSLSGVSIDG